MGLKFRLGLAMSGLMLSSMFGVNMLSGIKVTNKCLILCGAKQCDLSKMCSLQW
jgi:hypothetical protein